MKHHIALAATLAFATFGSASAATSACLIEGVVTIGGKSSEVRDCIQSTDARYTEEMLRQTCSSLAAAGAQISKAPPKVTYMGRCPPSAQGHCVQPAMTFSYYKRSPQDLAETKTSCEATGGTWKLP